MKIGIDARFWGLENTGIGRYLMHLVGQLEKIDSKNKYVIFLRKKNFNQLKFKNSRFKKILADFPHYSIQEQLFFPKILKSQKLDLVHFPHFNLPIFYQGKMVVTIHDLIKHESKGAKTTTRHQLFYWPKYLAYLVLVKIVCQKAKKIIVPSIWWQKKLIQKFALTKDKVQVTYESAGEPFANQKIISAQKAALLLKKYNLKKPFVIYAGNLYPHKNIFRLAQAVAKIASNQKLFLVLVGSKNVFWQRLQEKLKKENIDKEIVLSTGFILDKDLASLYQLSCGFAFPSLLEGFGLPGLEAMAAGTPVIASNSSCLPEIYGQAALYFDPKNIDNIASQIKKVLNNKSLKKELIRKGKQRAKEFSWQKLALQTLDIYESIK